MWWKQWTVQRSLLSNQEKEMFPEMLVDVDVYILTADTDIYNR